MPNPMLEKLDQVRQQPQTNNMLSLLQNSNNPQELMKNMLAKNPQIMSLINQYGHGDPKTAFYEYARINGQDPQQILNMIRKFL